MPGVVVDQNGAIMGATHSNAMGANGVISWDNTTDASTSHRLCTTNTFTVPQVCRRPDHGERWFRN